MLFNRLPGNQALNFVSCSFIGFINKALHQLIAACINPIGLRFSIRLTKQSIHVINHIPRTININLAKTIAIIPLLGFRKMLLQIIYMQKLLYLRISKTKLLIKASIGNRKHLEIIQAGKNTLLRNAQAARQNSKLYKLIRL